MNNRTVIQTYLFGKESAFAWKILIFLLLLTCCSPSHESGMEKYGRYYVKEYPDGRKIYRYENGQIAIEEFYTDGKLDGEIKHYFENGKLQFITNYKNGKKHGLVQAWNEDGVLVADLTYNMDRYAGAARWYYDDGALKTEQIFTIDGKKDGAEIFYYPGPQGHGKKAVYNYRNDMLAGEQTVYDPQGNRVFFSRIIDGTGEHCLFYDNGKKWLCGSYRNHKRHGKWEKFDEEGRLVSARTYDNGK